jgi:Ca-activated chloride channel family protein
MIAAPTTLLAVAPSWRLADPLWLLALVALPLVIWLRGRARVPVLLVPFAAAWHRASIAAASSWTVLCGVAGLVLLVGALARPQRVETRREVRSQGYDIMLAIDLSGSMLSEDYERDGERINRLQAIKPVIQAFIERRTSDRIGVVLFSAKAYTLAPLTTDHAWLSKQLERVKIGLIEDGTAIGDALGVAIARLDQSKWEENGKRKGAFIVLLTDGGNNMGAITPTQSALLAKARGIPIYTIGAGKDGYVPYPIFDDQGKQVDTRQILSDLDEDALRAIASTTGAQYFRAADTDTIESAFKAIDSNQKIEFQAKSYLLATELFPWLAVPGLALFGAGAFLSRKK